MQNLKKNLKAYRSSIFFSITVLSLPILIISLFLYATYNKKFLVSLMLYALKTFGFVCNFISGSGFHATDVSISLNGLFTQRLPNYNCFLKGLVDLFALVCLYLDHLST